MTYDELNARQYALAYAIAGGEDASGLLDTVSTEDLVGFIRAERAQARDTQDALMALAAAEAREAALREAIHAVFMQGELFAKQWRKGNKCNQHLEGMSDAEADYSNAIAALIG